ncbi:hypothetical protein [Clostridium sporogenes]|nr:hypothetical protein [Clostridium sporogenes]
MAKIRVSTQAINRYKNKARNITSRSKPFTMEERKKKLKKIRS